MTLRQSMFPRPDGQRLALYEWRLEDGKGLVQIAHGMAEHAARYDRLANALNEAGYSVFAHDQRGHGKSSTPEELGHFGDQDGWRKVLDDVRAVRGSMRKKAPDVPLIFLGHSMGSFIALADQISRPGTIDRLVLSGSNRNRAPLVAAGLAAAKLERFRKGPRYKSALLAFLSFGSFNKAFEPTRTEFDWLSRDPDEVDKYVEDERCGFGCTTQLWIEFLSALLNLSKTERVARLPAELPTYLLSGGRDPVGDSGKGVRALAAQLREAGLQDVTTRIYEDAHHEMFNETNRDEVVRDLVAWMDRTRS